MAQQWSIDTITDETYRTKFINVPDIIAEWVKEHGGITGRDVLDFGCGEGTMAVAMALRYNARRVVAIEIQSEIENCQRYLYSQLCLSDLPQNLELYRFDTGADLGSLLGQRQFDLIYSWSVFEHVSQPLILPCLKTLKNLLRPTGVMFLQTTPLYYSAEGSHLKPWISAPWAHLSMQRDLFYAALRAATSSREQVDSLIHVFESLNRITAPKLLRTAQLAGFEIIREYRTYDECEIPSDLLEIYSEEVLGTNQLVFLARVKA